MTTTRRDQRIAPAMPRSTGEPRVEIVIVVCDGCREYIGRCLASLATARPGDSVIHVVDNNSTDGSAEIAEATPGVHVYRMGWNAGFSRANNHVLRAVRAPYVLILNPDTEVPQDALVRLMRALEGDPSAGVVGPALIDYEGIPDHNAKRSMPSPASALRHFLGDRTSPYRNPGLASDGIGYVDAISGACMLVRRDAMEQVGLFDEGFWMYGEDLDWCARFRQAGWHIRYQGDVTVLHAKGGATGDRLDMRSILTFHRAMGRFYRRHQAGTRPLVDLAVYSGIGVRLLATSILAMLKHLRRR